MIQSLRLVLAGTSGNLNLGITPLASSNVRTDHIDFQITFIVIVANILSKQWQAKSRASQIKSHSVSMRRSPRQYNTIFTNPVTGSSRGIGAAIAIRLASYAADVVVNYHSSPKAAEAVTEECRSLGVRAICIQADVSKPEPIAHLFKEAIDEFGAIDIVMSNSGIEHFDDIPNVKSEDIYKVFDINVEGQFLVAQQAFAHVRDNGRVILMSPVSAVWV